MLVSAAALMALVLSACGDSDNGDDDSTPKVTPTIASQVAASPTPVAVATSAPTAPSGRVSDETVAFQANDGATLRGHLYSIAGPQRRAVILIHGSQEDQRTWQRFARDLAERGIAAFTFDLRGYGDSAGSRDAATVQRDLSAALLYMQARDYPLIYLLGFEIGGMAALKVAAAGEVAGVATIASPLTLMGMSVQADLPRITERKLFIGPGAEQLAQLTSEPKEVLTAASAPIDQLFGGTDAPVWLKVMEFVQR